MHVEKKHESSQREHMSVRVNMFVMTGLWMTEQKSYHDTLMLQVQILMVSLSRQINKTP